MTTSVTLSLRPELPKPPARIALLPVDRRGYPVPWFVAWIDGEPEFRVADGDKKIIAINEKRCWVCGQQLGSFLAFTVGPMCAVNRISGEPPSHRECAEYSARACPFLSRPNMRRREAGMPEEADAAPGLSIKRNPGVALVWITKSFKIRRVDNGFLCVMGDPREVLCFAEGRLATADEIRASVDSGLPLLRAAAEQDGPRAIEALEQQTAIARTLLRIA
jgi:hypothetical protein